MDQPVEAIIGIKIFTELIPDAACLLIAVLLTWYPLRGEKVNEIQQKVVFHYKAKKKKFEEAMTAEVQRVYENILMREP